MSPGTDLTGLDFFLLIAPVVVILFGWVAWVLWADTHPTVRHAEHHPGGYQHVSYARTEEDVLAGESAMTMSAADEEPARATTGAEAGAASAGQPESPAASQSAAQPGQESR